MTTDVRGCPLAKLNVWSRPNVRLCRELLLREERPFLGELQGRSYSLSARNHSVLNWSNC
jgi:hypothetical protein